MQKNKIMAKILDFIKRNVFKPIKSTYLCLKYPFLYPRNRFTGKHYNNWQLHEYHVNNYQNAVKVLLVEIYKINDWYHEEGDNFSDNLVISLFGYYYKIVNGTIEIYYLGKLIKKIDIYSITQSYSSICKIGFSSDNNNHLNFCIVFDNDTIIQNSHFIFIEHIVDRFLYFKIKLADFLNDYILQLIHCIPTYTEIDAMKYGCPGWYKRFGKQLLADMKKQLKKDKMLYSFRIMQIKEKWGSLCIYCNYATTEMYNLLERYSSLSEEICIDCGKDADVITSPNPWQCPYCNDCYKKYHPYDMVLYKKDNNGNWIENIIEK